MCRCCCKDCKKYKELKEQQKRIRKGKQSLRLKRAKAIWKNYKITILFIALILLLPIIVGIIYAIPIPQVLMVESGDVLSYYATSLGIIGSFITYREEKKKEKKERNSDIKPRLVFNVTKEDDIFNFVVTNTGKYHIYSISLFQREICSVLPPDESKSVKVKFVETPTKSGINDVIIIDIGQYENFEFDNNGTPKWIQVLCNDIDNQLWGIYYDILPNEDRIVYMLSECSLN